MTISDNPYFKIIPGKIAGAKKNAENTILEGESWSVYKVEDRILLEYVSGELAGREKSIEITEAEFSKLQSGN